jgi:starvation-inducible DNA-binding protein
MAVLAGPSRLAPPGGLAPDDGPIAWIADNQLKGISAEPAVTIHATHAFSLEHWERDRQESGRRLLDAANDWLGAEVGTFQVHGWLYSKPLQVDEAPARWSVRSLRWCWPATRSPARGSRVRRSRVGPLPRPCWRFRRDGTKRHRARDGRGVSIDQPDEQALTLVRDPVGWTTMILEANMKKPPVTRPSTDTRLTDSLNQVLADSYALLSLTHLAHWNVEGPGFFALHTAFQTQYEELFIAIDEIAERIRALDAYAIGGLGTLARVAQMKEFVSPLVQEEYVRALIAANGKLVSDAARARDVAGEAGDAESQDLMIGRITLHQKTVWMLKSFLKA